MAMKKLFAAMLALATLTAVTGRVEAQLTTGRQRQLTPLQAEDAQKKKAAEKAQKDYEAEMKKTQGRNRAAARQEIRSLGESASRRRLAAETLAAPCAWTDC